MGQQLVAVLGPTASGKTSLGIEIARRFGGQIVSVDARQVYREMDIGTGKDVGETPFKSWRQNWQGYRLGYHRVDGVPIWLVDVVSPAYRFTVADYVTCAREVIGHLWRQNQRPVLVGGTGFYLKTLLEGAATIGVGPDGQLRRQVADWPLTKLQAEVEKNNPCRWQQMNRSDRANPRRLVRVLEVSRAKKVETIAPLEFECLIKVGLRWSLSKLDERIEKRVVTRLKAGAETEVRRLVDKYGWSSALGRTIAYQEWQPYFAGFVDRKQAIHQWLIHEQQYARRQLTWFKKDASINWFRPDQENWQVQTSQLVKKQLSGK